jgi:hypothetical protein
MRGSRPSDSGEAYNTSAPEPFQWPAVRLWTGSLAAKTSRALGWSCYRRECFPTVRWQIGHSERGREKSASIPSGGFHCTKVISRRGLDTMEAAGWGKQVIDADKPKKFFLDVGGVDAGVYDRLKEWGERYASIVVAVNFGSAPLEPPPLDEQGRPSGGPANRRAEMWMKSKQWLEDPAGAQIPDSDSLQADACGPAYRYDSNTRLVLESKADMRRRGLSSPDEWDAVALTFAEPVAPAAGHFHRKLVYRYPGAIV